KKKPPPPPPMPSKKPKNEKDFKKSNISFKFSNASQTNGINPVERKRKEKKKAGLLDLNYDVKIINEQQSSEELDPEKLKELEGIDFEEDEDHKNGDFPLNSNSENEKTNHKNKKPKYIGGARHKKKYHRHEIKVDKVSEPSEVIKKIPSGRRRLFKCYIDWDFVEKVFLFSKLNFWRKKFQKNKFFWRKIKIYEI
ncbi:hypothetical protein MHBO_004374, partial [Bonamia ostreae]